MRINLLGSIFKISALLMITAIGGLVFANLFHLGAKIIIETNDDLSQNGQLQHELWWKHCGWFIGAGLAFIGTILGICYTPQLFNPSEICRNLAKKIAESAKGQAAKDQLMLEALERLEQEDYVDEELDSSDSQTGRAYAALGLAAYGNALGLILGCALAFSGFSITYSPFSTDRHPVTVAFYLFWSPIILGIVAGGLYGLIFGDND